MSRSEEFAQQIEDPPAGASRVVVRILATTDLHAYLMPYNYYTDTRDDSVGLVRIAGLIDAARAGSRNCILVDNGDTLQGSPLGDVAVEELLPHGAPHPMIAAMNALGYDVATLGNHEFDYGPKVLGTILSQARFPVVAANVHTAEDGGAFRPGRVILTRTLRDHAGRDVEMHIGITGIVPPQTAMWNRAVIGGTLVFSDTVAAVAREVSALRADGADIVVVLAHTGRGDPDTPPRPDDGAENTADAIAALPGVDAVVAGHTHEVHPAASPRDVPPGETPMVQPGNWGSHLGCMDLALDGRIAPDGDGSRRTWSVVKARTQNIPVRGGGFEASTALRSVMRAHPQLRQQLAGQHRATRRFTSRELGETAIPLNTYFSFVAPCAATQLVADAQHMAGREAIADHPELQGLRMLSAVAPFRAGGRAGPEQYTDIAVGPLRLRHAHDLYCFPNLLAILRARGSDLRCWLERSASIFRRIDPDAAGPQALIDDAFAPYNFDRIDGLLYDIDISRPARTNAIGDRLFETDGRIRNMRFADGTPLDPDAEVLVVTNSYRASGGGHFRTCFTSETVLIGADPVRDHVARFIAAADEPLSTIPGQTFRLCGLGGAEVVFATGAGALRHLDRAEELGLARRGDVDNGVVHFTLNG
ncbi:bifunctional 2',3'-cyclic-nucleotide 2'-phosphodiesterase/3'-nucleotidase [Roseibacterium sp. SDUM158017]|uniref:bifunctional 2',3'-cyclic-nucleotide 2'-phosphodiesterase/3'-nucleotidase n=1 Tax=Roseicyclus salinarum TaxID=3036773 RepID=UPI0024155837|nr:bifunctional 2',3'-cyclic-nucleotide 2'-phosphodiesterase/3'-nucleotidase [Roseibacterium sp. SDUM158017]MDG4647112.1 bifunctional 2',3'-cyclic-nucleotide 2'-phosphodiesterase/3'-nucleotidase [Roseibacterium sp. SDUM158017]